MLAWGNVNLFDFKSRLITSKYRLDLWPAPLSMDSMNLLHPTGITGKRLPTVSLTLTRSCERKSGRG